LSGCQGHRKLDHHNGLRTPFRSAGSLFVSDVPSPSISGNAKMHVAVAQRRTRDSNAAQLEDTRSGMYPLIRAAHIGASNSINTSACIL
jgi:hypothetical protein